LLRIGIALATLVLASPGLAASPNAPTATQVVPTLAPLMREVTPAVVNISVKTRAPMEQNPLFQDPFLRRFFDLPNQPREPQSQSVGSGVIVDARKGLVLTNHHVIANATEVSITLKDSRQLPAKVVGSDSETDIALLQVKPENLTQVPLGDSDKLEVGDYVVAIGNPFGLGQTVTMGIVSALGRTGLGLEGYEDFIQTDASINPGNSGGALVSLRGELIGINTAIIGPSGGNVGIGFAVPINMARAVADQLAQFGEVRRGRIGVSVQDLTADVAQAMKLDRSAGALVTRVEPNSPADKGGLKPRDVVTAVGGRPVKSGGDLRLRIGLLRVGDKVDLNVIRDGQPRTVSVTVGQREQQRADAGDAVPRLAGASFSSEDQGGRSRGVLVSNVEQNSPAWQAGLRQGDVIVALNRQPVSNVDAFLRIARGVRGPLALNLVRGEARMMLVIQ
jgi:serine protease Do/serine protease DegQ